MRGPFDSGPPCVANGHGLVSVRVRPLRSAPIVGRADPDIVRDRAERFAIVIPPFQRVDCLATDAAVRTYRFWLTLGRRPARLRFVRCSDLMEPTGGASFYKLSARSTIATLTLREE